MTAAKFHQVQMAFAGHLRDPNSAAPENIEDRRMAIYRRLVFNNIQNFCSTAFPVLKSLLTEEQWQAMIRDFMIRHRCQRPLFNQIAREFIEYLENERDTSADPIFIKALAHYEWVELALGIDNTEFCFRKLNDGDDVLTIPLQQSRLAWLLAYDFPVHKISPQYQPDAISETPHFLLVYRNEDDQVKFIEFNAVSARLLEYIESGLTGQQAAANIAAELQDPSPEAVEQGARQMIQDWLAKGIVY
ncbi:DNA-binding domain-containing protein [Methylophaga sp. OBS3]|uniref:HvfC family RiPP maturation protein n=1 Tax=Methylophaga sp. OBS3 TaxID=2991934 RepID=UPI0022557374|nr:putative DNA-binding domain-containing protein [Methylophaga sp. OBS3]MCX4189376.1 putative DNA-binding domain-containing protein [Methylophaga sp. OBS3]